MARTCGATVDPALGELRHVTVIGVGRRFADHGALALQQFGTWLQAI